MLVDSINYGGVDRRFLAKSIGLVRTGDPIQLKESATLEQAIAALQKNNIGCLLLVDDEDKLKGIFSERDLLLRVMLRNLDLKTEIIGNYMTPDPITIQATHTVAFALNLMSQGGFRHLPVVDESGEPVGIVSVKDIVDYIVEGIEKDLESAFRQCS